MIWFYFQVLLKTNSSGYYGDPKRLSNEPPITQLAGGQVETQTRGAPNLSTTAAFQEIVLPSRLFLIPEVWFCLGAHCSTAHRRSVCPFAADTWDAFAPLQGSQSSPISGLTAGLSSWYLLAICPSHSIFYSLHTAIRMSSKMPIRSGLGIKRILQGAGESNRSMNQNSWNQTPGTPGPKLGPPLLSCHLALRSQVNAFSSEMLVFQFLPGIRTWCSRWSKDGDEDWGGRCFQATLQKPFKQPSSFQSYLRPPWELQSPLLLGCLVLWCKPVPSTLCSLPSGLISALQGRFLMFHWAIVLISNTVETLLCFTNIASAMSG